MKRRNEARKNCGNKKREMIDNEIKDLGIESRKNENRKFYKKMETLTKNYIPRNRNIKARVGSVFTDEKGILNRWNEHFKRGVRNNLSFMKIIHLSILMKK